MQCGDQPQVQNGFKGKTQKQKEPFEAPQSPVSTPREAFIWVVIVSAKPTKCLQPASPCCTRCKPGDGILADISPGSVGLSLSLSLPTFFSLYKHVGITDISLRYISLHNTQCFTASDCQKGFISFLRAVRSHDSKRQIESSVYVTTNKWQRSRSVATASLRRSRRPQVGTGPPRSQRLHGPPGGASLALGRRAAGRRFSPRGCLWTRFPARRPDSTPRQPEPL